MIGKAGAFLRNIYTAPARMFGMVRNSDRLRHMLKVVGKTILRVGYPFWKFSWFFTRPHLEGAACLVERQGRILLVRMSYGPNLWNLPGGRIRRGERPEAAALRETVEEVGLILPHVYRIGCIDKAHGYASERLHIYYGEAPIAEFVTDDFEIKEAKWFRPANLPAAINENVLLAMDCRERFLAQNTLYLQ
jgi:ADP-ribose pyrophosphatase YjhB (NUDIX family)